MSDLEEQDAVRGDNGAKVVSTCKGLGMSFVSDLGLAFGFLSRFPVPLIVGETDGALARAVWAFPIVGAAIGAIGGAGYILVHWAGLDPLAASFVALCVMVFCSGGLHEDGLADFFDGIGGGRERARRLEIMRDSRIGTYGVLALLFLVGFQVALVWSIARVSDSGQVWAGLVSAGAAARAAIIVPMAALPAAREDGLGILVARAPAWSIFGAVAITLVLAAVLVGFATSLLIVSSAMIAGGFVAVLAWQYLGGQTGDVLGAAACLGFASSLIALAL